MKDITSETTLKLTFKQLFCIASFLIIGALGYADLRYEVKENRKATQALVEQNKDIRAELSLYSLKRNVLNSQMLIVREFNRTNKVDEKEIELRLQMTLDAK